MTERTKYEAVLNCQYGYWYNDLNQRLYSRIDFVLTVLLAVASGSTLVGLTPGWAWLNSAGAVVVAILSTAHIVTKPSDIARDHADLKKRFWDLNARAGSMDLGTFDLELSGLQSVNSPLGMRCVADVAFNECLKANGHAADVLPEIGLSRLVRALV